MKNKKFKLFASLTSLVMVVAVMAVGVWAATSATATIKGTASFSATGILGNITATSTNIKYSNGGTATAINNLSVLNVDQLSDETGMNEDLTLMFDIVDGDDKDGFITSADLSANVFTITYTITNEGTNDLYYKATVTNPDESEEISITAVANGSGVIEGDAQTKTATITVTYSLAINGFEHSGETINLDGTDDDNLQIAKVVLTLSATQQ